MAGGPQFARVETYALAPSSSAERARAGRAKKGGKRAKAKAVARERWTVADICAEAMRLDGHCEHVAEPRPPALLLGVDPTELPAMIAADVKAAKRDLRGTGTRIREDTRTLVTFVASYPLPCALLDTRAENRTAYEDWKRRTVEWAQKWAAENGAEVVSAVEHTDEEFPHVHVYALPRAVHGYRADQVHPGKKAKAAALAAGADGRTANEVYKTAMRGWQDAYYRDVGEPYGLERLGPNRMRLPRAAYLAHRDDLAAAAAARREAERTAEVVRAERVEVTNLRADVEQEHRSAQVARDMADLARRSAESSQRRAEEARREVEVARQEVEAQREALRAALDDAQRLVTDLRTRFGAMADQVADYGRRAAAQIEGRVAALFRRPSLDQWRERQEPGKQAEPPEGSTPRPG